ncbi:MBL fold metallo-hydrolase [Tropicimonas sp. IMCC34043]|uniref:MBL fold metallo-hydrolase n=1 Tax=Tropicimonas sp. IMCC34043 TaxID=2248760 RepID=UPI0018E59BAF|nr:MBL fold metallo-hydrolase [Tropicimonas sp. IMCC34043]
MPQQSALQYPSIRPGVSPVPFLLALVLLLASALAGAAQDRRPSHCIAMVQDVPGLEVIWRAGFRDPVPDETVRLSYIDHSMYLIQTAGGLNVVTDYNGFIGPEPLIPDVVTMNHAHSSHWSPAPDPAIAHVLQGWGDFGEAVEHNLDLGEMLIRNVTSDIRSAWGAGVEPNGNSIFIFEVAGLCIGHLGHLHQEPSPEQYAAIGRLDVVMAPVDGGLTLPLPAMIRVLKRLRASVVLPMHYFSNNSLTVFLDGMEAEFLIDRRPERALEVSLRSLPSEPTVVVLTPRLLGFNDEDL